MTKPQIGGYSYHAELTRIRNAANAIRSELSKLLEGNVGPQMLAITLARTAIQVGTILDALTNLEGIGRKIKDDRTGTEENDKET